MESDDVLDNRPPQTLQDLERALVKIGEQAWEARAEAYAARFAIGNVLLALRRAGVFDAQPLIESLLPQAQSLESSQQRHGVEALLSDLSAAFEAAQEDADTSSSAPPGTVFH